MGDQIQERMVKFFAKDDKAVTINAAQGHFATSQSHINFYIDVTRIKIRVKEAMEAAKCLKNKLMHQVTTVDTIVCLDGTEVLGAFLASELERGDFRMTNAHETIYVIEPEENSVHQFMFRENVKPAVQGKNVLVLVDSMTTGETVRRSIECIEYYGGIVQGVASIFSTQDHVEKYSVYSLFTEEDLPGYNAFSPSECPYCAKKIPLDAIVSGYGYSKL